MKKYFGRFRKAITFAAAFKTKQRSSDIMRVKTSEQKSR